MPWCLTRVPRRLPAQYPVFQDHVDRTQTVHPVYLLALGVGAPVVRDANLVLRVEAADNFGSVLQHEAEAFLSKLSARLPLRELAQMDKQLLPDSTHRSDKL